MSSPLVSIVLPAYNGERYIRQQLDSIFAQTIQDFEVIVADDVSSDSTVEILEEYSQRENFSYTVNQQNLGFIENFSQALKKARGQFIAPCDQDDIWLPHKLETLLGHAEGQMLVYSNSELVDENDQPLGKSLKESLKINFISGDNHRAFYYGNCVAAHTMLFRRELLDYLDRFPDTVYHDHWIAFVASRLGSIQAVDEKLVLYRRHQASVTRTVKKKRFSGNLFSYLRAKAERQSQRNTSKLASLKVFQAFNRQLGKSDELLDRLVDEYSGFDRYFFNRRIHSILKNHEHEFFAIRRKKKSTQVLEESLGRKFYQYIPVTL